MKIDFTFLFQSELNKIVNLMEIIAQLFHKKNALKHMAKFIQKKIILIVLHVTKK